MYFLSANYSSGWGLGVVSTSERTILVKTISQKPHDANSSNVVLVNAPPLSLPSW